MPVWTQGTRVQRLGTLTCQGFALYAFFGSFVSLIWLYTNKLQTDWGTTSLREVLELHMHISEMSHTALFDSEEALLHIIFLCEGPGSIPLGRVLS